MSSLGYLSIYSLINSHPYALAERVFVPSEGKVFSFESKRALGAFDLIAASLSLENDYWVFLDILERGGLSPLREEREAFAPLILAGGIGPWSNPVPLLPFCDVILTGEGEISWPELLDLAHGRDFSLLSKRERLLIIAQKVDGAVVPEILPLPISKDLGAAEFKKGQKEFSPIVPPRLSFPFSPELMPPFSPINTPLAEFSSMRLIETSRGCPFGCRFCLAGFVYRPHRPWPVEKILQAVSAPNPWDGANPFEADFSVGLVSPAVASHPDFYSLIEELIASRRISFSSIRLSALTEDMAKLFAIGKLKGLAVAPEAGSQRLRDLINKNLKEDEILNGVNLLARSGLRSLKLYFMLGLPGEEDLDLIEIAALTNKIKKASIMKSRAPKISITVSNFTPRPHTPFEDIALLSERELIRKGEIIVKQLLGSGVEITIDPPRHSLIMGYLGKSGPNGAALIRILQKNRGRAKPSLRQWDREAAKEYELARPWRLIEPASGIDYLEKESQEKGPTEPCPKGLACGRCKGCAGTFLSGV
ncbi:MAG: radical SAM protein [Deltaproteobacteria bacterium]|jgi:radical SAM superfamily enzyme YgiQ (UPF0313 family)|nr:radical SAM protein [Deltaproteobacteria bacterium]